MVQGTGLRADKIVLYRQDDGSWVAEVPAIAGCYALMPTRGIGVLPVEGQGLANTNRDTLAAHAPRQSRGKGVCRAGRSTAKTSSQTPVRTRVKH